jgi:hypothetical protein
MLNPDRTSTGTLNFQVKLLQVPVPRNFCLSSPLKTLFLLNNYAKHFERWFEYK